MPTFMALSISDIGAFFWNSISIRLRTRERAAFFRKRDTRYLRAWAKASEIAASNFSSFVITEKGLSLGLADFFTACADGDIGVPAASCVSPLYGDGKPGGVEGINFFLGIASLLD